MAEGLRIALLGRAGDARDHLRRALADLGADIVVEGDPVELDPGTVGDTRPGVLVISLDSAMEEQLDRWDGLLDDPSINVVFDEADVTRQLSGWDLARWARHLASKVMRAGDLLPPLPAEAERVPERDPMPEPGAPPTPAELMKDARLEDYTLDTAAMASEVPAEPLLSVGAGGTAYDPVAAETADDIPLELDLGEIEEAFSRGDGDDAASPSLVVHDEAAPDVDDFSLDPAILELEAALDLDEAGGGGGRFASFETDESPRDSGDTPDVPQDAADAMGAAAAAAEIPASTPAPAATFSFGALELVPLDGEEAPAHGGDILQPAPAAAEMPTPEEPGPIQELPASQAAPVPASGVSISLDDLVSGFGLTDEPAARVVTDARGAIVLVSGMGGPDAVRQFLAGLPEQVPVPVLIHQHLEAGNHDRLAPQLSRASQVPVYLAEAGSRARGGEVAILPAQVALRVSGDGSPEFVEAPANPAAMLESLSPYGRDIVVVIVSGADPAVVEPAQALAAGGALVLAQDPATCFDGRAAEALNKHGSTIAAPADLAMRAVQHWLA